MLAITEHEIQKLIIRCNMLKDGPDYRVDDYVSNLLNTVLDFQMNTKTVNSAITYYEDKHGCRTHKELKDILDSFPNTKDGNLKLARFLWNNNHWSRAKFLRKIIDVFEEMGIKGQESLIKWVEQADFETDIKGKFKTEEHSIGYTLFQWLRLRLGIDTVKPDVHVINFVTEAIGRQASPEEAVSGLLEVAKQTKRKAALLDAAIWHYQRDNA